MLKKSSHNSTNLRVLDIRNLRVQNQPLKGHLGNQTLSLKGFTKVSSRNALILVVSFIYLLAFKMRKDLKGREPATGRFLDGS